MTAADRLKDALRESMQINGDKFKEDRESEMPLPESPEASEFARRLLAEQQMKGNANE